MVTPDLLEFIRTQHEAGITKDALLAMLVAEGGWTTEDVDEAYVALFELPPTPEESIPQLVTAPPTEVTDVEPHESTTPEIVEEVAPPTIVSEEITPLPDLVISSTTPSASSEDDFLGIFGGTPEAVTPVFTPITTTSEPVLVGRPVEIIRPEVTPSVAVAVAAPNLILTPSTPASQGGGEVRTSSLSAILAGKLDEEQKGAAAAPAIKFNLSSIGQGDILSQSPTLKTEKVLHPSNTPRTSMSESLLSGSAPQSPSPAIEESTPSIVVSETPVTASTPVVTPKTGNTAKRTMASDLLLRGMGGGVAGMPALSVPDEVPMRSEADIKREEERAKLAEVEKTNIEGIVKKNNAKRLVGVIIGVLTLLAIIGIAFFAFTKYQGPSSGSIFQTAASQFYSLNSFTYKGDAKIDLVLSTATDGIDRNGVVKFALTYGGSLLNSVSGYGNGVHRVKLSGGLQSGNFAWPTDVESDIRVVGSTLYFRVLSFPETSNLDPELFKTYWIKVSLSDVAAELALSGLGSTEGYGSFGGQSNETTWNALIQKHAPFSIFEETKSEQLGTESVYRVTLHANPENIVGYTTALYRKYLSKDLVLSTEQQLRLKNALSKIVGEVWISEATGMIVKTTWSANFDDDMVDAHVKGTVRIDIALSEHNKELVVASPTPILTLEELKVRMEDFKKISEARVRDQEKVDRLKSLVSALEAYRNAKARYPLALTELYSAGMLASSTIPNAKLKNYSYAPYINAETIGKTGRCTTKTKTCAYYQVGVNLEYKDNSLLADDADMTSDLRGSDESGCSGELDFACFDLIPPGSAVPTAPAAPLVPAQ